MQVVAIRVLTDSQLVAEQLSGGYEARDPTMAKYLAQVKNLTTKFLHFTLSNVPRGENERADVLAKLASKPAPKVGSEVEELPARAIEIAAATSGGAPTTWVQELLRFKWDGTLPPDKEMARRLRHMHAWYTEVGGRLYKRSFTYPLLRCLEPFEAQTVLAEVHEGIYGEHIGGRTLAHKILRQGYYWPTMCRDAKAHVQWCSSCQEQARTPRQPAVPLTPIDCAWPFAQWGLDLLGPFPQPRNIENTSSWVWIISQNNEPQFAGKRFQEFCANHGIKLRFSSVAYPQTNGLAELTNQSILDGLKRRVSAVRSAWTDELPSVLWSLRTTPKTAIGESPYSLAFRTEAVLPPEVAIATLRTRNYDEKVSNEGLRASLDVLEERRANVHLNALSYKRAVARVYNRKVRP
ncbi:uncharacterized protein LOC135620382 [Musa acuminata AAA Group]|uniref:uncharacterized protein LOC135620382 n=1 Tax=Musa acuminata AAA Group TaxID=214697 RepID=UPI0031DAC536